MLLLYFSAILFLLFGVFLLRTGFKKESIKSVLMKVTHAPAKNYGKLFSIAAGILCIVLGIMLLFNKI